MEHEADVVGTGVERGIERALRAQSADFDFRGHLSRRMGRLAALERNIVPTRPACRACASTGVRCAV